MTIEAAVEVFVRAFSLLKSRTHPYLLERVDGLWVMHDALGCRAPRKTEIVHCALQPEQAVERVATAGLGWHFLCHVHETDADFEGIRASYKSLGYRALSTERLFVHDLAQVPSFESHPPPRLVVDETVLASIPQSAPQKRKLQVGLRTYCVWDDLSDMGWVTSVPIGKDAWVSDLYVHRPFRGNGLGRALMSRLLKDDQANGVRNSVLLASSDGARLYPHLGYRLIGSLQMFCPRR